MLRLLLAIMGVPRPERIPGTAYSMPPNVMRRGELPPRAECESGALLP